MKPWMGEANHLEPPRYKPIWKSIAISVVTPTKPRIRHFLDAPFSGMTVWNMNTFLHGIALRTIVVILLLPFFTLFTRSSHAAGPRTAGTAPLTWQSHLERLQKYAGAVGIQVVSLSSGKVVWEYRPAEPLVPASLVKLFTSYSALRRLGPNTRFTTAIHAETEPIDGRIPGNIWVRGEGDIFFVAEKARELAMKLKDRGVRKIEGGVLVDNGFFEPLAVQVCLDPDCADAYNPVISATSVDFNGIAFHVLPGKKPGAPAQVSWSPPGDYVELVNQAVTGGKKVKAPLSIQSLGMNQDGRERFRVSGGISVRSTWGSTYRFSVADPATFFTRSFASFLQDAGIEVTGGKRGTAGLPANARRLAVYESPPLKDLIYGLNRHSNNFMAEALLRSLGARLLGNPGTAAKGLSVVHGILHDLGISEREVALDNGSGLSRKSLASPRAFCRLLQAAHQDPVIGPVLTNSLAVTGQEGTLRNRMCASPFVIQGKTGTLNNAMGFAGYVSIPGGERYAVAIILNGLRDFGNARQALDTFLETLPMVCNPF